MLLLMLTLTLMLLGVATSPVAAAACTNASTLVEGESDSTAVVLLNNNELETFAPADLDNDMEDLELASNFITDLSSFNFPRRLNYLDLSSNSISKLSSSTPWPESGELQTLLLHGNSLSSVGVDTFTKLVALQSLSLSSTGISNLDDLMLPVSLRTLNATKNSFTSASTNFSNLPTALQYLNLESNGIKQISGVTFASTLRRVYLGDNPLSTIEICRSDVSVFQSLAEFKAPSSVSSTCSNAKATSEEIKGVNFCVLEDEDCVIASSFDSTGGSMTQADINDISSSSNAAASEESTSSDSSSMFSAESIGVIGSTFFLVGILLSALVFGFLWNKRRNKDESPSRRAAMKVNRDRRLGSSGGNFMVFTSSGRITRAVGNNHDEYRDTDSKNENNSTFGDSGAKTPGEAAWGVYESPLDKYNPVALLEPSPKDNSFLGASTASLQVRSKIKSKIDLDDLLVYEIPPEEIQMRRALHMSSSKKSSKAALALSSVGVGNSRKVDTALFLAEYQGYKVVIQALMRSKKRLEKRFVEQIRLAAALDHASIVHFIGVTTGCSTTASRRRGSSAAAPAQGPYSSYGPTNSMSESMASKSRYPNMGAPAWHLGVVFEYMQHGSLAAMFEAERHRREGKGFYPNSSVAAAIGSGNGNIFSWYPVFANSSASVNANPNADWRCKLSIALDVAMGLVYLHANNYAHGRVCARKVLVNEQGEGKLSAMDVLLPSDFASRKEENQHVADDFRGSLRESALWTMQKITGMRPTRSSKALKQQTSGNLGRSRYANNSGESDVSGVSSVTLDDNHSQSGDNPAFDENSLKSSGIGSSTVAAQRDDVYAFGTFLWELDTMIAVEEDLASSRVPAGAGGNPLLLKFSADCPMELQELAHQCWHEVPSERPDAIDPRQLDATELPERHQRAEQSVEFRTVVQHVVAAELVLRDGRVRGRSVRRTEKGFLMYLFASQTLEHNFVSKFQVRLPRSCIAMSAVRRHINTSDRQSNTGVKGTALDVELFGLLSLIVDPKDGGGGDVRTPVRVGKASRSYQLVAGNLCTSFDLQAFGSVHTGDSALWTRISCRLLRANLSPRKGSNGHSIRSISTTIESCVKAKVSDANTRMETPVAFTAPLTVGHSRGSNGRSSTGTGAIGTFSARCRRVASSFPVRIRQRREHVYHLAFPVIYNWSLAHTKSQCNASPFRRGRQSLQHLTRHAARTRQRGPRPTYGAATTPRSQRSAATTPRSQRSGSAGQGTILINLDVFIHRANIGRDISPNDEDLIVLFRRNSKEVTSEPARWSAEHCAVWNQHVGIQTSLLKHKKPQQGAGATATEFLKKEYEIVLVAPFRCRALLPGLRHARTAERQPAGPTKVLPPLASQVSRLGGHARVRHHLEPGPVPGSSQANTAANMMMHPSTNPHSTGLAGLPPSSTLLNKSSQGPKTQTPKAQTPRSRETSKSRRAANETSLDRKEVQVLQLESFLKESQKRIDALSTENEELIIREKAETRHAAQQRALTLRLLQELEAAVQLCHNQMQVQDMTLLPQVELIERVKKLHEEADPLHGHSDSSRRSLTSQPSHGSFDFRAETEAALQRNQRLQQQLEFLGRSMDYDSETVEGATRSHRAATDASGTTISSARSGSVTVECEPRPVALTMTQQLNNLERENFKLRAELEGALANAASALKKHSGGFPSGLTTGLSLTAEVSETTSSSSREDIEEPENEDAALLSRIREQHEFEAGRSAALESELDKAKSEIGKLKDQLEAAQNERPSKEEKAPGFLDKIYADVGKAKLVLEDRVKQLDEMLASATEENGRLRSQIEELQQHKKSGSQDQATTAEMDAHITELERLLEQREEEVKRKEGELARTRRQLQDAQARARADESANRSSRVSSQAAAPATTTSTSFISHKSAASDATGHNDELADVQKQLKLSKQEVMQLRFRSNQLESVHERLEDALKEKRTLEVKLTALEGQLFEQRSRTINTDNSSFTAPSLDAKSSAMLTDMQRELDQKAAQLMIAERDVDHLRGQLSDHGVEITSPGNIEDVTDKVKQFENEIARLCQRNDDQARKLEKLGARVTVAVRERDELEAIVQQMVTEMSLLGKDVKLPRTHRTPSIPEADEMEEKSPSLQHRPPPVQTGKITDRYANAVASSSSASHTPGSSAPGVTSSKVAQLMKNFSAQSSDEDSPGVSPSGVTFKRPTKLDFRNRKASSTSHRSNDDR
ncbi:Leucine-rich repeat domain, L domain-like [Phytophthora cactorum]|nr:Leucine-rich repeat domain, L domain-like [Phytophthora cactorum]